MPPPLEVQEQFDEIIEEFSRYLAEKTKKLSGDYLIAIVLCMAGSDPPTETEPWIILEPTVWIQCGNQKWQDSIIKALSGWPYLTKFLERFHMKKPHVSPLGPSL